MAPKESLAPWCNWPFLSGMNEASYSVMLVERGTTTSASSKSTLTEPGKTIFCRTRVLNEALIVSANEHFQEQGPFVAFSRDDYTHCGTRGLFSVLFICLCFGKWIREGAAGTHTHEA